MKERWIVQEKASTRYIPRELICISQYGETFKLADIYNASDDTAKVLQQAYPMYHACKMVREALRTRVLDNESERNQPLIRILEDAMNYENYETTGGENVGTSEKE